MKASEAIETLIGIRRVSGYSKRREEALDMAIAALEKQVGEKPIEDGYFNIPCACPMCGNELTEDGLFKAASYCPNCGQRIDWSDEHGAD